MDRLPSYARSAEEGILEERLERLESMLSRCELCPRGCGADRTAGDLGYCKAPHGLYISSAFQHFGEESPLVGSRGSGTIFLTHCNLKCVFCQNYNISVYGDGSPYSYGGVAELMIRLQEAGCHNINLVTPTHYVPQLIRALLIAVGRGLSIPLVYNCGGYESLEVIKLLDGIVDIYMPDIKFLDPAKAKKYCRAEDYPRVVKEVVREMHRQVGDLEIDGEGLAWRGLLIRHLVVPSSVEDTKNILRFIKDEISEDAYVNIMSQYRPCHRAGDFPELSVRPGGGEFSEALKLARTLGLTRAANH